MARRPDEHRPRAVDVVDAPAAPPRAARLLRALDEIERALHLPHLGVVAEVAHQLEVTAGQIGGRLIEHRLHVGEGDLVEELAQVVGVEGAPAAVPALHAEGPVEPALEGALLGALVGGRDALAAP